MKKTLLVLVLFLLCLSAAVSYDGYLVVYNRTGYTITELYVSHEYDDEYGDDVLGSAVLDDGDNFWVDLEGYKTSIFDVMAVDEDGDTYHFWNLDVEYNDLSLTIDYLDE